MHHFHEISFIFIQMMHTQSWWCVIFRCCRYQKVWCIFQNSKIYLFVKRKNPSLYLHTILFSLTYLFLCLFTSISSKNVKKCQKIKIEDTLVNSFDNMHTRLSSKLFFTEKSSLKIFVVFRFAVYECFWHVDLLFFSWLCVN